MFKVITNNKSPGVGAIVSDVVVINLFCEPAYGTAVAFITLCSHNTICCVDPPFCLCTGLSVKNKIYGDEDCDHTEPGQNQGVRSSLHWYQSLFGAFGVILISYLYPTYQSQQTKKITYRSCFEGVSRHQHLAGRSLQAPPHRMSRCNNAALDAVGTLQTSRNPEIGASQMNTITMAASKPRQPR